MKSYVHPRIRVFGSPRGVNGVIDQAVRALNEIGERAAAEDMLARLDAAPSDEHLSIISEYVEDC